MIYYSCFTIQLPLFESSQQLLDQIQINNVLTISTSTGSGKSSLLPALLIAEGYDKVIVTQPRRLPCTSLSQRVNETMTSDTNSNAEKVAGWAVSGDEENPRSKIVYLTDGLLKERLLYDENFLPINISVNKSIVLFIDEVHERSVNIDLCLALIARTLTLKKQLISKIKIIISSATLDNSVGQLFNQIPQIKYYRFTIPTMGTNYPVAKFNRPNENILDIVQELYKKKQRHDQILCFVNSVSEVNQCCRLLAEISRGAIVAYPLIQSQQAQQQQLYLEHGSVFFSTTVAETSLTFPSLKYVIDTGMINIPVFDIDSKQTVLKEVRAAESTIKQRYGRLGRTRAGEYYALYDFDVTKKPFPTPQICQSDLVNIEFSLRKSPLQHGLNHLKQYLPNEPSPGAIKLTIQELVNLSK
jgi:HrpA-like RNA helicase